MTSGIRGQSEQRRQTELNDRGGSNAHLLSDQEPRTAQPRSPPKAPGQVTGMTDTILPKGIGEGCGEKPYFKKVRDSSLPEEDQRVLMRRLPDAGAPPQAPVQGFIVVG